MVFRGITWFFPICKEDKYGQLKFCQYIKFYPATYPSKCILTRKRITLGKYFGWLAWPKRRGVKIDQLSIFDTWLPFWTGLKYTPVYTDTKRRAQFFGHPVYYIIYTLSYILDLYYTLWHLVSAWSLPFVFIVGFSLLNHFIIPS